MHKKEPKETNFQTAAIDVGEQEQKAILKGMLGTIAHFFGSWKAVFAGVRDGRNPDLITYPLVQLLCTGVLLFVFRLGSRRQVQFQLRENRPSQAKMETWFDVAGVPHGDTLNYGFQRLQPDEMQTVVCSLVETMIRKKLLYRWRWWL